MLIAAILFIVILVVIVLFAFPQFSPIPYFPSNVLDMDLIIKAMALHDGQTVFDLGAGDGIVIFKAAERALEKGLDTEFVAVEINPILVAILHIRRLLQANRRRIRIVWGDLFKMKYSKYMHADRSALIYIYVTPRLIGSILHAVQRSIPHFTAVSYFYPMLADEEPLYQGIHKVFKKSF